MLSPTITIDFRCIVFGIIEILVPLVARITMHITRIRSRIFYFQHTGTRYASRRGRSIFRAVFNIRHKDRHTLL